tara:strand:+ start:206 stop:328 length:123 start_codon:yes stop_codon:yes gene_type:complete
MKIDPTLSLKKKTSSTEGKKQMQVKEQQQKWLLSSKQSRK